MPTTQEFLSKCTDDEINKGVAWIEAKRLGFDNPCEYMSQNGFIFSTKWAFSPCTNPNDIMLIAFANRIDVIARGIDNDWYAAYGKHKTLNANPLRAICEVYILMSVSK